MGQLLVGIRESKAATGEPVETPESQDRSKALELELTETRETLQAVIQELESSNEEQQATNEELTASNEELQSTNEELQSVNQELYTINFEYQSKIHELSDLTNDLNNLLSSTNIGVVFLDADLKIRRFTPSARRVVRLLESDVGRSFEDLQHNLDYPDLMDEMKKVLSLSKPLERELETSTGWVLVGLHPYRTNTEFAQGVVMTLVDTTFLRTLQRPDGPPPAGTETGGARVT